MCSRTCGILGLTHNNKKGLHEMMHKMGYQPLDNIGIRYGKLS